MTVLLRVGKIKLEFRLETCHNGHIWLWQDTQNQFSEHLPVMSGG
jgi:hypothetical protein